MRVYYFLIIGFWLFTSCKNKQERYVPITNSSSVHQVKVMEVIQGGSYTFLFVNENNQEYWMAVNKSETKVDDLIYYKDALKMVDFKSKELNREFELIYFVQNISDSPSFSNATSKGTHQKLNSKIKNNENDIHLEPVVGGTRIGDLYKNRLDFSNKKVIIRGVVVKINKEIMDRNWVHLRDGTHHNDKNDLTFTTQEHVKVGDTITFKGTVALDKEYGAGYVYPLIVEEAIVK